MSRFQGELGNERLVKVVTYKGEHRIDLREWKEGKPTKKGISITPMRWKNFVNYLDYVDHALSENETYSSHLGGNVYCSVEEGSVDIRQYWKPEEELVPTKKGLRLRPLEYARLKGFISDIGKALPELDAVVPCYLQSDHMNQIGALQCSECNPNDFINW